MKKTLFDRVGRRIAQWEERSTYTVTHVLPDVVLLVDEGEGVSVTNEAEAVIEDLREQGLLRPTVVYRDSDGNWDELLHDGEKFLGFKCCEKTGRRM